MEAATVRDELQELGCEVNPDGDIKPSQPGGRSEKDDEQDYFEDYLDMPAQLLADIAATIWSRALPF